MFKFFQSVSFFSLISGILVFIYFTGGGKILDPTYIEWLFEGDSTTHWLGWQFFRYSPLLQWPLGTNISYGLDISSSVVFTSTITIFALFFKIFNDFLPNSFQYSGLWILICFALQSFFSCKILMLFSESKYLAFIGSLFFAVAPVFLWRLQYHYALSAHWIILASFYLYLVSYKNTSYWCILLCISSLIEPYLLAMAYPIFLADLIQRIFCKESKQVIAYRFIFISTVLFFVMWAAGYFMLESGTGASGFGHLRTNLLSFIDPDEMWSNVIQNQTGGTGDYEGFAFFGLGMLILLILSISQLFYHKTIYFKLNFYPLVILLVLFFFFALSNNVGIGSLEFFSYKVPFIFEKLTLTLRSSGRFIWPVYYFLYIYIFFIIFKHYNIKISSIICTILLLIQFADSYKVWIFYIDKFSNAPSWSSPLQNPVWEKFASQYNKIIWVNLPRNSKVKWFPLCQFAATHKMSINHNYQGRNDPKKIELAAANITLTVENNSYDPNSLYIFEDDILWMKALNQLSKHDESGIIDGYRYLAPGFKVH